MNNLKIETRKRERPTTTKLEFGHNQMDNFSPSGFRERIITAAANLPHVTVGTSKVSEPSSVGFHLSASQGPENGFLYKGTNEFAHVHTTGFLHISMPPAMINLLIENGWAEIHPVTRRPDFYDNIVMVYAPVDEKELSFVIELIKISYNYALGIKDSSMS